MLPLRWGLKLGQIENLNYPDKETPDTAYLEVDATYINLQHGKKKKEKLEVKVEVGYTGKEARYKTSKSKRLKGRQRLYGKIKSDNRRKTLPL